MLGPPVQLAYAVGDVDAAAEAWRTTMRAGPFVVQRHIDLARVEYRGQVAMFDHSSAYGQWGSVMVELVQSHGESPNIVTDLFGTFEAVPSSDYPVRTTLGLHHVAFIVDDLDDATGHLCESFDAEVAMTAVTGNGTEFRFVDTSAALGHMVELYERTERIVSWYAHVASLAGEQPSS